MNKAFATVVVAVVALAAIGCDTQQQRRPGLQQDGTVDAQLFVQGSGAGQYTSVLVDVAEVRITVDGRDVPVFFSKVTPDLASGNSVSVASFRIPKGGQQVDVTLRLDDWGGFEYGGATAAKGAGYLDARGPDLHFQAPAAWLYDRGHAVVMVDLARSLIPRAPERVSLVAQAQVAF